MDNGMSVLIVAYPGDIRPLQVFTYQKEYKEVEAAVQILFLQYQRLICFDAGTGLMDIVIV
jgi:hypothetical protein